MGPPKKREKEISFSERVRRVNYFEYRWSDKKSDYYLFNPYTGETIIQSCYDTMDRSVSMWGRADDVIVKLATGVLLYAENYRSRSWGRRAFIPYENDKNRAVNHIITVWYGYKARRDLSKYFNERYFKRFDNLAHYFYFFDRYADAENASSWHKPILALAWDITEVVKYDPEDHLHGSKYSWIHPTTGPYTHKVGINKGAIEKSKILAFTKPNELKDRAISLPSQIDLETTSIGDIIAFFDGDKAKELILDEYMYIQAAMIDNDWERLLHYMEKHDDNVIVQIFALRQFAAAEIPFEYVESDKLLTEDGAKVLNKCVEIIKIGKKNRPSRGLFYVGQVHLIFAMQALSNILNTSFGIKEYFSTNHILGSGDERDRKCAAFISERVILFSNYYTSIDTELHPAFNTVLLTRRGVEIAYEALLCTSYISQDIDTREEMAFELSQKLVRCMKICMDHPEILQLCLQTLYNFCYRAEGAQESVIKAGTRRILKDIRHLYGGDVEVAKRLRKLELALFENGHRGYVDELVHREMKGEELENMYTNVITTITGVVGIGGDNDSVTTEGDTKTAATTKDKSHNDGKGSKSPDKDGSTIANSIDISHLSDSIGYMPNIAEEKVKEDYDRSENDHKYNDDISVITEHV